MNEKNSILNIKHTIVWEDWTVVYWKDFDSVHDRGLNYILPPNQKTTVNFSDEYCDYNIVLNNEWFVPAFDLKAWYSVKDKKCWVVVPENIKKYVTTSVVPKNDYQITLTTGTPSLYLIWTWFIFFVIFWIVIMNSILNKKKKYVTVT